MIRKICGLFVAILAAGCTTLPTSAEWNARGDGYFKDGKTAQAIKAYNKAIVMNPDNLEAYASRGAAHFVEGNFDLAANDFKYILKANPYYADAYTAYGSVLAARRDFANALEVLNMAIEMKPSKPENYFSRGGVYVMLGQYANAVSDYTAVLNVYPAADVYNARGIAYAQWGKKELAAKDFEAAKSGKIPASLSVYSQLK